MCDTAVTEPWVPQVRSSLVPLMLGTHTAPTFTCSSATSHVPNHPVTTDISVLPQYLGMDEDRPQVSCLKTKVKSDLCSGLISISKEQFHSESGVTLWLMARGPEQPLPAPGEKEQVLAAEGMQGKCRIFGSQVRPSSCPEQQ